jgi:hypothetical protein
VGFLLRLCMAFVTGNVHLKKEAPLALRTLEILPHPELPVSTSRRSDLGLVQTGEPITET